MKAMVAVTSTGHFVTAVELYLADNKNSDANIIKTHTLKSNLEDIKQGFSRCYRSTEGDWNKTEIPCFIKLSYKQQDANASRFVSKIAKVLNVYNRTN